MDPVGNFDWEEWDTTQNTPESQRGSRNNHNYMICVQ